MNNARRRPVPVTLANLRTTEVLEAHLNPESLAESIGVNWEDLDVLGLSHKVLNYANTDNLKIELELFFRVYHNGQNRLAQMDDAKRFLYALTVPSQGAGDVRGGAPPRVLVVWPETLSLACVVEGIDFNSTHFGLGGHVYHSSAKLKFKEIRDGRLTSEDVRARGLRRGTR